VDEKVTPIWNVMGVIPGHVKNEVVVIGAHRDGEHLRSVMTPAQILIFSSLGNGSEWSILRDCISVRGNSRLWGPTKGRMESFEDNSHYKLGWWRGESVFHSADFIMLK
jgi:hypothetical protein